MSKTGEIISGNAAAASLSVQNERHSSEEKQSFVNQNESGNRKKKSPKTSKLYHKQQFVGSPTSSETAL